jgi:hypothetical protein
MILMRPSMQPKLLLFFPLALVAIGFVTCQHLNKNAHVGLDEWTALGLQPEVISAEHFFLGIAPEGFEEMAGAAYKPSHNEEPAIPAQCWIETGYGTQNACKYCHTDYLATIGHGNNYPIAEDQVVFSFPSPALNRILWDNVIYPQKITERLKLDGIELPDIEDVDYVRVNNWKAAFEKGRGNGDTKWLNTAAPDSRFALMPALDPNHLFPYVDGNPTSGGQHGYVDKAGYVRDESDGYTGWRSVNFFPYAIFTPLTGSVSGVYVRLPEPFQQKDGVFNYDTYQANWQLLADQIRNRSYERSRYYGDAEAFEVQPGFYPTGTEFAHPLHYVDLLSDGEHGTRVDGVVGNGNLTYEFPGTRSKRVKEIRYMYKWKNVGLEDISIDEEEGGEEFEKFIGKEGQGWVDNGMGWILAAFIENRHGELRPQTTEELTQCIGCHSKVGNTIDAVWSFQRQLPGDEGWGEMNYGQYASATPEITRLNDYYGADGKMGEQAGFYHSVVGGDLYGVMPDELRDALSAYAQTKSETLDLSFSPEEILNDDVLKDMPQAERKPRLFERQKLMRRFADDLAYLYYHHADDQYYIKGTLFYPSHATMQSNIQAYRKVVLDQSYNLGKDVFGSEAGHVPFTFRSDGSVLDENHNRIPVGEVIYSRPYNKNGVGITPTGIVRGETLNKAGTVVGADSPEAFSTTGTLDWMYNPILSDQPVRKNK